MPSGESSPAPTLSSESCRSLSERGVPSPSTNRSALLSHWKTRRTHLEGTTSITDKRARRRQQNRKSQRAFRDRKEAYQKYLEDQVDDLKQKHTKLLESFTSHCKTVSRLRATIGGLNSQIVSLRAGMCHTLSSVNLARTVHYQQHNLWISEWPTDGVPHIPRGEETQQVVVRPSTVSNEDTDCFPRRLE